MAGEKRYSFCHGWMVSRRDFTEVTCKRRDRCAYYDVYFYRHHGHHLDEFDEMFPYDPCEFFIERTDVAESDTVSNDDKIREFLGLK